MPVVYGAGNFGETFDLGRAYTQAENVKGMQQDKELRGLQMDAAKFALDEAKKPKPLTYEQQLDNTKLLHMAASEIAQNPATAAQWVPRLQQSGILDPKLSLDGLAPEQIQATAQEILKGTTAALESVREQKQNEPPTELQIAAAEGVDIKNPAAVAEWRDKEDARKAARAPKTEVSVNLPGGFQEDEASKQFSKLQGEDFAGVLKRGNDAQDELSVWQTLRSNPAVTGPTQDFRASMQAFAADLGLPLSEGQLAQITNLGQYRAAANDLVLKKQLAQKGPQTESDARRMEKAVANTKNIREVNDLVVRYSIALKNREIDMASHYDKHRAKTGKLDGASQSWREYARKTPLAKRSKTGRMVFEDEFMASAAKKGFSPEDSLKMWRQLPDGGF